MGQWYLFHVRAWWKYVLPCSLQLSSLSLFFFGACLEIWFSTLEIWQLTASHFCGQNLVSEEIISPVFWGDIKHPKVVKKTWLNHFRSSFFVMKTQIKTVQQFWCYRGVLVVEPSTCLNKCMHYWHLVCVFGNQLYDGLIFLNICGSLLMIDVYHIVLTSTLLMSIANINNLVSWGDHFLND